MEPTEMMRALEEASRGPFSRDLDGAPLMNPWRLEEYETGRLLHLRLHGPVSGHPEIDDPYVTTSPVLALSPSEGWARTRSRWYRLGPDWQAPYPQGTAKMASYLGDLQNALALLRQNLREGLEGIRQSSP